MVVVIEKLNDLGGKTHQYIFIQKNPYILRINTRKHTTEKGCLTFRTFFMNALLFLTISQFKCGEAIFKGWMHLKISESVGDLFSFDQKNTTPKSYVTPHRNAIKLCITALDPRTS